KLFNGLRGFLKSFSYAFCLVLREFLYLCGKKIIEYRLFHGGRHGLRKTKAGGNCLIGDVAGRQHSER
ncbi:MAG: hypothetical protein OXE85_14180, partial [Roseovarius sp.]|nr:hypothetical protein [Roseovarius sp.]